MDIDIIYKKYETKKKYIQKTGGITECFRENIFRNKSDFLKSLAKN
jgi:hypothetical protein